MPRRVGRDTYILRVSITLPAEWKWRIDEYMKRRGMRFYADFFREAARRLLEAETGEGGEK